MNRPTHYTGPADVLDLLAGMGYSCLHGFCAGNVLKYTFRAGRKSSEESTKDLEKAAHYLELLHALELWVAKHGRDAQIPRPAELVMRAKAIALPEVK